MTARHCGRTLASGQVSKSAREAAPGCGGFDQYVYNNKLAL
jgi:hypothetical protein